MLHTRNALMGEPDLKQILARRLQSTVLIRGPGKHSEAEVVWAWSVMQCFIPPTLWCKD